METIKDKMRANFAEQQKFLSETAAIELTREQKKYEQLLLEKQIEVENYAKESEKSKKQLDKVTSELKENKAQLDLSNRCLLEKSAHEIALKKKKQELKNDLKVYEQKEALLAKQLETLRKENYNLRNQFKEEKEKANKQKEPAGIQNKLLDDILEEQEHTIVDDDDDDVDEEEDVILNASFLQQLNNLLLKQANHHRTQISCLLNNEYSYSFDEMDKKNKNDQIYQDDQKQLQAKMNILENEIAENMVKLEDEVKILAKNQYSQYRQKIRTLDEQARNITLVLDSTKEQLQKLSFENQKLKFFQNVRSQESLEHKQLYDATKEENRTLQSAIKEGITEYNLLTEENIALRNRCSDSDQNVSRIKEECKQIRSHSTERISELEIQIREQNEQIQSLQKLLDNQDIESNIWKKFLDIEQLPNLSDKEKIQISTHTADFINSTVQKAKDYYQKCLSFSD